MIPEDGLLLLSSLGDGDEDALGCAGEAQMESWVEGGLEEMLGERTAVAGVSVMKSWPASFSLSVARDANFSSSSLVSGFTLGSMAPGCNAIHKQRQW